MDRCKLIILYTWQRILDWKMMDRCTLIILLHTSWCILDKHTHTHTSTNTHTHTPHTTHTHLQTHTTQTYTTQSSLPALEPFQCCRCLLVQRPVGHRWWLCLWQPPSDTLPCPRAQTLMPLGCWWYGIDPDDNKNQQTANGFTRNSPHPPHPPPRWNTAARTTMHKKARKHCSFLC